ncbi:winged helix-turn-helix domain-containing protein [Psychromarinibacter sp. C21-152]|uniref:Winged helix-turn-helix domain-containing protein n=1 Tax=Psychromarinibacter sediminicola TaxID=3033385 RepID=A0AAE3NRB3_9RHOB|nr:winged helix-turn-helix domain-containing protein [Psychromarinibacter sediminicola]MDF0601011.1 winged helix-turn-helix domain-containing protein [Psychromarinibacter sediminicola]
MRYAFADCLLDTGSYTFSRAGEAVRLEPQVFDLLRLLAETPGQLVTRDRLIEAVWQGRIVSEATISARIAAARTAVGDTGKAQAVIRTVPRRGIELIAPVRTEAAADPASPGDSPPAAAAPGTQQTIRYTTSPDGTMIAYTVSGTGPPLVMASHHVTHLERDWASPLYRPILDALSSRHRLIRYDIRGTGLSDPAGTADTLDHHLADLRSVARAAEVVPPYAVLAVLNSAAVAIRLAATRPDEISRLVLLEGYARGRAMRGDDNKNRPDDPFISLLQSGGWGDPANGFMRAWVSIAAPGLTYDDATHPIELIGSATRAEDSLKSRAVIDRFDARPDLPRVTAATLVSHARNDTLHPLAEGRLIAACIPGAAFNVVESGNTLCLAPDPASGPRIATILDFLARP